MFHNLLMLITLAAGLLIQPNSALAARKVDSSTNKNVQDRVEFSGYLMLDHDYYGPFYAKSANGYQHKNEIRRAKLGISFTPNPLIKAKLQLKYSQSFPADGKLALGDALVRFNTGNDTGLQVGRMKQAIGLEYQSSSSQLIAIERSLPSSAFAPDRSFGIQLDQKKKHYTLAAGYFIERDSGHDFALSNFDLLKHQDKDIKAGTLRMTYLKSKNIAGKLHFGGTFSRRWLNGQKIQFKESGEIHSADSIIRSARFYADHSNLYQLDMAWLSNKILIQGEVFINRITAIDHQLWNFYGAYIQSSYLFSGEYQYKRGRIKSSQLNNNTLELVFRQSYLNLRDNSVGSQAAISLIGLNLHISKSFKLMANISQPWISGDTINTQQSGQAYSFRGQFNF